MQAWIRRLIDEHARGGSLGVESLASALAELGEPAPWIARACFDTAVPYGRCVLVAQERLELMIAGWSRGQPCAPHDHGAGQGAVRVLQGAARHRGFGLHRGELRAAADEVLEVGAVLRCRQGFIHQMHDDGAVDPLVTLHVYSGTTAPMTVYDLARHRTQWLGPGCGAWPREFDDAAVLRWADGFMPA